MFSVARLMTAPMTLRFPPLTGPCVPDKIATRVCLDTWATRQEKEKKSLSQPGFEPRTFRVLGERDNQLHHRDFQGCNTRLVGFPDDQEG